jgi:integrase
MDVDTWVADLAKVLAPSSIPKAFQILDRLMAAAVRDKRIPFNPCDGISLPKKHKKHPEDRKPPTYEQLGAVRGRLPRHYSALQITAQETGLRWGELAGLRLCNLNLDRARLEVREVIEDVGGARTRKVYPKSDAGLRTVPLTPLAVEAIRAHLEKKPASANRSAVEDGMCPDELVFRGQRGAVLTRTNFRQLWVRAIQDAEVARKVKTPQGRVEWWPQFHKQRHAYASRLHDAGVPEVVVQEILGHERGGEITWLYTHAAKDTAGQVLAALTEERPALRSVS